MRRADLLGPLGDSSPQSALKDGTGRCICEDPDFVAAYRDKHALEPARASAAGSAQAVRWRTVEESPKARTVFLLHLVSRFASSEPVTTLVLKDHHIAALTRDQLATQLSLMEEPLILVLDLAGITLTPSALQELILPLAQRIRGGEYGTVRLVISTTDPGVAKFNRYSLFGTWPRCMNCRST